MPWMEYVSGTPPVDLAECDAVAGSGYLLRKLLTGRVIEEHTVLVVTCWPDVAGDPEGMSFHRRCGILHFGHLKQRPAGVRTNVPAGPSGADRANKS